jgi:hypothetical protein
MPKSRRHDPATSVEAAESVWCPSLVESTVLDIVRQHGPICDDEIYRHYTLRAIRTGQVLPTPQSVRSRRSELVDTGLIEWSGLYSLTPSMRRTREWGAVFQHCGKGPCWCEEGHKGRCMADGA